MQTTSRGRLTRVRAQAAVTACMERVRDVNQDEKYAFKVDVVARHPPPLARARVVAL